MTRIPPPIEAETLVGSRISDYKWRATEPSLGSINAIKGNLTILARDGNLAVFTDTRAILRLRGATSSADRPLDSRK
jgi:hypothetical protein